MGAAKEVRGAAEVAGALSGHARGARRAWNNGAPGAVWAVGGRPQVVFTFTITDGKITGIDLVTDPERLGELDVAFADDQIWMITRSRRVAP